MQLEALIALTVVWKYGVNPILFKRIAGAKSRTRNLVWQFAFAAFLSIGALFARGESVAWGVPVFVIAAVGAVNAFACYAYWRAIDISLSKTSLFMCGDDLITLGLGYVLLDETKFLSPTLAAGVALSVTAAFVLTVQSRPRDGSAASAREKGLLGWIAIFTVVWGSVGYLMRASALNDLPTTSFLASWYMGASAGAFLVFVHGGDTEAGEPLTFRQTLRVFPAALGAWTAMLLTFWTFDRTPLTVAQPIFQVAEMVVPTAIGLIIFGEHKELRLRDAFVMLAGMAGVAIIAVSF